MSWAKREAVTNFVVLGDGEGQIRKIGGLLADTPRDRTYPDKVNYLFIAKDGEEVLLSGSASLARQINEHDIGKFVKCEFKEWGKSANGKFKVIDVNVWEGEATEDMRKWPRYDEFHGAKKAPAPAVTVDDVRRVFDAEEAHQEDDLPF